MLEPAAIRVLVIDDDPAMVALMRKLLNGSGYNQVTSCGSAGEAIARSADADLIILDYQLPDSTGVELLPRLLARTNPPSVVMVTGAGNETLAAVALRAGADDYLPKDGALRDLFPQIVERVRRTRALKAAQAAVEHELVRAERLAAIGEMTVTLHHEINNPLMSASAEVELLLAAPELSPSQREALDTVRSELLRIRTIIKKAGDLRQARSTDYLSGLKMITLGGTEPSTTPVRGKALLRIPDEETGRVISLLLRHAGFSVEWVSSILELQNAANRLDVSLVVLSGFGDVVSADALGGFRPPANRLYAVVALVSGEGKVAEGLEIDQVIRLPFDPATVSNDIVAAVEAKQ